MNMKGHGPPVLTARQMNESLGQPIRKPPLREIAAGKKTAVITFYDLTRATPTCAVAPWVLAELKAAGIEDENILFPGSFARHRPLRTIEVQKKLGKEIAARYGWLNHGCFYGTKEIGTTIFKNKVEVNQTFLAADLKITLSGIKVALRCRLWRRPFCRASPIPMPSNTTITCFCRRPRRPAP
jgi:nickel-dependent lactate racemase